MKTITWTCDRCFTEHSGHPALESYFGMSDGSRAERDLCSGCVRALVEWIDRGVS